MAQGAQPPAMPAAVGTLFDHVKRLNAACVAAGGGVSGSPDCDAALAREQELEGLGYCIDYPNDEALVRCPASHSAAKEQKAKP